MSDYEDNMTEAGAHALARRIADYWSARNLPCKVWVEKSEYNRASRLCVYSVRSDMINGRPR